MVLNLIFSTDDDPQKSKSKCLYMCGHMNAKYPAPLQLYGKPLPWVVSATHLGHEIHQLCNMEQDANLKRIKFIDNSTHIRETFSFADPTNILQAVQLYSGDAYGSMLLNLYGERTCQY